MAFLFPRGDARLRWRGVPKGAPTALTAVGAVLGAVLSGCSVARTEDTPASTVVPSPGAPSTATNDSAVFLQAADGGSPGQQIGTAKVLLGVSTLDGGKLTAGKAPGGKTAYRFPPFVASGKYPRAAVIVNNASPDDTLDPGEKPFAWGASFKVDAKSKGRESDNGDNLIQRGLFSEPTFYKAELDDDKPACTVRGTAGLVIVRSTQPARPNVWYRMRCDRVGRYLSVRVWEIARPLAVNSEVEFGKMGNLDMRRLNPPLSIGGKVSPNGQLIVSATDQFNGLVAEPFVRIGDIE